MNRLNSEQIDIEFRAISTSSGNTHNKKMNSITISFVFVLLVTFSINTEGRNNRITVISHTPMDIV